MTKMNKEQAEAFWAECEEGLNEEAKWLIKWGWTKKEDSINTWVSPDGKEYLHSLGWFGGDRAFYVAQHQIVLKSFEQFKVVIYENRKNSKEEGDDFYFPCVKDGKIYHYSDAVNSAIHGFESVVDSYHWLAVLKVLKTLPLPRSGDVVKLLRVDNRQDYKKVEFRLLTYEKNIIE